MSHRSIQPKVMYFGTPVVLVSTLNEDGTANIAPMSSAWWLGPWCVLGFASHSRTPENLLRTGECVLNLPSPGQADSVDAIALVTGTQDVPECKVARGYQYEPHKFERAGLTPVASEVVSPPRAQECPIQLEAVLEGSHRVGSPDAGLISVEVRIVRSHVHESLIVAGSDTYIDPDKWDPLIMKFCEYYGYSSNVRDSELARGWNMPKIPSSVAAAV